MLFVAKTDSRTKASDSPWSLLVRCLVASVVLSALPFSLACADEAPASNDEGYRQTIVPLLKKYCLDCHGPKKQEAELGLHKFKDVAIIRAAEKPWQSIIEMVRSGAMPPADSPQPTEQERTVLVQWIERTIFQFDCQVNSDPGRVTLRRLNRAEYNNTIRDLLGVDFKPAADFPSDDVGNGFDNIGDVLSLPPLLMEKYLDAAETIADEAIVPDVKALVTTIRPSKQKYSQEGAVTRNDTNDVWNIVSKGTVTAEFDITKAGNYIVRTLAGASQAGPAKDLAQMEIKLDGRKLKVFSVSAAHDNHEPCEVRFRLSKGTHRISATFLNDFFDKNAPENRRDRNLYVTGFEIVGPQDENITNLPKLHQQLVEFVPGENLSVVDAARKNLKVFMRRAFRRQVSANEIERFALLVEKSVKAGDTFEQGMQVAITGVLVSPHFLFRVEKDPKPNDASAQHLIGEYELANRLSYFLWSSMPDNELFAAATNGQLSDEAVLRSQVKRMLADPRSSALVDNFAMQWLNLRLLDGSNPDPKMFNQFSPQLKADMVEETKQFCRTILLEDRSILDFLDADYTFLNERLARHYGISGVFGEEFRKVSLRDGRRAGVITQGSVLTLTSNPSRTSPVKRGKWIMENILGAPPPDPPPDVPNLDAAQKAAPDSTLRQQLELHRANPACASCHRTMDMLGFGLENYNAVGQFRQRDDKHAIDSSGTLPNGDSFQGAMELIGVLKKRKSDFARCYTQKMLTFSLGRGLKIYDRCVVDEIVTKVEKDNYRFSTLVTEIVCSDSFRKRRGDGGKP